MEGKLKISPPASPALALDRAPPQMGENERKWWGNKIVRPMTELTLNGSRPIKAMLESLV